MHKSSNKLIFVSKLEPYFPEFTTEEYIEYSEVCTVLAEATKLFLRKTQCTPANILAEFCQQYIKGEHVLLKAFSNFNRSSFNRLCFVCNFSKVFEIQEDTTERNGFDYLQLIRLICSDFPRDMVVSALKLCSGDYDLPEETVFDKMLSGKDFTKGLFISCMYADLIKEIERMGPIKLDELLRYVRESYKKKRMQFQKPSYKVMMDLILKLGRHSTKEVVFVNDASIDNYVTSQPTPSSKVLNTLYSSQLNDREVEERLQFLDVLSLRVNEISKIFSDKEDPSNGPYKSKKKKK